MALLESCTALSKSFSSRTLFENISLGISEGERLGLIGRNGSGKTTLLKILSGRLEPDSGAVSMRRDTRVGYVPQDAVFPAGKTVAEIIAEPIAAERLEPLERAARINLTLGRAGFTDGSALAESLSGGWKRRLAIARGAQVYEHTPVLEIQRGAKFSLRTPGGTVAAEKMVLATNAYSHLLPELKNRQAPAWTYMIATEPLSDRHFAQIRWQEGNGVEDARNLIHYYRITPDNRLVMGGGPVGLSSGANMDVDSSEPIWRHLEEHTRLLFPALKDVKITHRWGGPFSVTLDLTPAVGYLGDRRAVYSVSTTHQNAITLTDLLMERQTENTACPFVNRRVIPWPPEPLRSVAAHAIRAYLRIEDWAYERKMAKFPAA